MSKKLRERIVIIRPFAYIDLLGYEEKNETVVTKRGTFEARRLLWRFYWVGAV